MPSITRRLLDQTHILQDRQGDFFSTRFLYSLFCFFVLKKNNVSICLGKSYHIYKVNLDIDLFFGTRKKNNIFPPKPDPSGSPLPRALFCNSVGYLPDGTPMNAAGNAMNHPETMQPDMHTPGSPLPKSVYYADVGYLVDGTDMAVAGNLSVQVHTC